MAFELLLKFSDEFIDRHKAGYFHEHPNSEVDENGDKVYNDAQHFKRELIRHVLRESNNGDKKIHSQGRDPIPQDSIT